MHAVADEIDLAIASLGLDGKVTRLSPPEAAKVNQAAESRFVVGGERRRWWEAFPTAESVWFDDGFGYQRLPVLVQDASDVGWFIVAAAEPGPYPVYEASPADAVGIVGECSGFEYYIVARDLSWRVCENHYGCIIGSGTPVEAAIRRLAA